jgi:ABC-type glycerol-3-phosphate transport system permease component
VRRRTVVGTVTLVVLILLLVVNATPVLLIVRQSLATAAESTAWPLHWFPESLTVRNIAEVWDSQNLGADFALSVWVAFLTTVLVLVIGAPAAWAAARYSRLAATSVRAAVVSRVLPPIAIALPLTSALIRIGLYDQPLGEGLVLAHAVYTLPVVVLVLYAGFRSLPLDLEEAAHVDGCSVWSGFVRIALPAARGTLATAALLVFLLSWDEFTYALLIQLTHRTMPPLIYYYSQYGELGAASTLALVMLLPSALVIAALQRLVTAGAMEGLGK